MKSPLTIPLAKLAALVSLLFLPAMARAGQVTVTLDTRALIGNAAGPFYLGFQLADGTLSGDGNNAVTVSNVQFGGGSATLPGCSPNSGASGDLSSSVTMTDLNVFAICTEAIVPGSTLSFDVSYTANTEFSGPADEFVAVILGSNYVPIATTGGIALFQIDFDSANPTVQTFAGDPTAAFGGLPIALPAPTVSGAGTGPSAPVLSSPSNGATGVSLTPTLTWSAASGATSYDVYFGPGPTPPAVLNTGATSYAPPALTPGTSYTWQIVARNAIGTASSATWSFTTSSGVPTPTGANPGSGSSLTQTFTFTFTDPSGWQDLGVLDVLINNYLDGIGACYFALTPASASSGYLYLVDDAGDGGYVSGTPMLLPSSNSLQNSQCRINATGSSVSASGSTLTLTLAITFKSSFAGNRIFYTAARSSTQNSGWQALGTWNVPGSAPPGPAVGGVSPGRSTTMGQTYTFTFTDTSGYTDLAVLDVLTNSFLDGISGCYLAYVPATATSGYLYLVDDAGDGGYVTGSPMSLPSSGTLQNSQCSINVAGSSASASGNTLTLNLSLAFKPAFAGNQVFYLAARNNSTGNSGWQAAGSVTVP